VPTPHPELLLNLGRLGFIAGLLALCFVGAARLRQQWGITPIAVLAGMGQAAQSLLGFGVSVELFNGISINPGSTIFFPATLFAILLVYVLEDEVEAKRLIYGILIANLVFAFLTFLVEPLLSSSATKNRLGVAAPAGPELLLTLLLGSAVLAADAFILIRVFEWFGERVSRNLLARATFALGLAVTFDALVFPLVAFSTRPKFGVILLASVTGKVIAATFYSCAFVALLRLSRNRADLEATMLRSKRLPGSVTYKDRFKELQQVAVRDALTGVFNRAYFDHEITAQTERAVVRGDTLLLLLIDLDSFKKINDTYGHPVGDRVLSLFGEALRNTARQNDTVCRYGGEEFAILISGPPSITQQVLDRTRDEFQRLWNLATPPLPCEAPKVSAGAAVIPTDATVSHELLSIADGRLYISKRAGGNRLTMTNES
jgi:diguanylate cyclase (GGDEF)-like protein